MNRKRASSEGKCQVPFSAPPNLVQELSLCDHPHAMAKTPTEQAYSVPLINKAAIMMFLLPRNSTHLK
jgi:hypothetical protein